MMKMIGSFLWISLCSACSTLQADQTDGPYGPETNKAKSRVGKVVYNPNGLKELVDIRRENALKKIYTHCGDTNKYAITKEYDTSPNDVDGGLATAAASSVHVIEFECASNL